MKQVATNLLATYGNYRYEISSHLIRCPTCGELVFPQVVPVGQVGVGVDVPRETAKDVHATAVHHRRVVVARRRRRTIGHSPAPRFLLHVKAQQIVQHSFPIVAAEDVDGILIGHHGVLGASSTDKLVAFGHFAPPLHGFERTEVEGETFNRL
jgi:hypothetical protein